MSLICIATNAQTDIQDVIYLKNGSIIRGIVIEQVPAISVKIETVDHNVLVFKMDEIQKIVKEKATDVKSSTKETSGLRRGYLGMINLGYGFGVGKESKGIDFAKFDLINGYQFNPFLYAGFGTGIKYYFHESQFSSVIPMFADIRAHFTDYIISPFLAIDLGYSLEETTKFHGLGFMINPSIGATFKTGRTVAVNFGIGYLLQKYQDGRVNSINLDLGFLF